MIKLRTGDVAPDGPLVLGTQGTTLHAHRRGRVMLVTFLRHLR
ncbi:MAG: hypothetical protein Q8Q09_13450 [Deltaproteobacteria bacterium]|nr:hypothetical protein [Deltaproteobacteria bacterium]